MGLTNQQLILESVQVNHGRVNPKTRRKYQDHLEHYDEYITSALNVSFYDAKRKHVLQFMDHLEQRGGPKPHESRQRCEWCKQRGYPDGDSGEGWSASTRKSYLSAIRFLYKHFYYEEDLPDINPAAHIPSPKIVVRKGYTPSESDVKKLLDGTGKPPVCLLAHWAYFAPTRLTMFANARWRDFDLERRTWEVVEKGSKVETFALHPTLVRKLREYSRWQQRQAQSNPKLRDALSDEETAYVLLTRNGKRTHPSSIYKMLKWHAIRAGVAVTTAKGKCDAPGGKTSKVHPHAFRRAWGTHALNNGVPIDVVQEVLGHADISTTRKHYAHTKPERARDALLTMPLPE
jgi:integrase